ncbi:hypothetical protein ABZ612_11735 [Streptomyces avermitilis]|uniref:hypothetical protein n=1 Tax=Streptomyces avermitilis TaxID=33903 RepID=UPI0034117BA5
MTERSTSTEPGPYGHPALALAATAAAAAACESAGSGPAPLLAEPSLHTKPVDAVSAALDSAFAALPPSLRATAPLYVLCDDYSVLAARRLAARCTDPVRRLRPSDSVAAETSELVRPWLTASGRTGRCYLLAGTTAPTALRLADPAAWPAAVVCELALVPGEDPYAPGLLAVAAVWGAAEHPAAPAPAGQAAAAPPASGLLTTLFQEGRAARV